MKLHVGQIIVDRDERKIVRNAPLHAEDYMTIGSVFISLLDTGGDPNVDIDAKMDRDELATRIHRKEHVDLSQTELKLMDRLLRNSGLLPLVAAQAKRWLSDAMEQFKKAEAEEKASTPEA